MPAIFFQSKHKVIQFPFTEELQQEFSSDNPVIRRIYLVDDQAHFLRIDAQGAVRRNDMYDLYDESHRNFSTGITAQYQCPLCNEQITFNIQFPQQDLGEFSGDDDLGIPSISKQYQCVHVHGSNGNKHGCHIRIKSDGEIVFTKIYPVLN